MSLHASRNTYPGPVDALAQDIKEQPTFHADAWERLKEERPAFCLFFEERLLDLTHGDADVVSRAMTALTEADALDKSIEWSQRMRGAIEPNV